MYPGQPPGHQPGVHVPGTTVPIPYAMGGAQQQYQVLSPPGIATSERFSGAADSLAGDSPCCVDGCSGHVIRKCPECHQAVCFAHVDGGVCVLCRWATSQASNPNRHEIVARWIPPRDATRSWLDSGRALAEFRLSGLPKVKLVEIHYGQARKGLIGRVTSVAVPHVVGTGWLCDESVQWVSAARPGRKQTWLTALCDVPPTRCKFPGQESGLVRVSMDRGLDGARIRPERDGADGETASMYELSTPGNHEEVLRAMLMKALR